MHLRCENLRAPGPENKPMLASLIPHLAKTKVRGLAVRGFDSVYMVKTIPSNGNA
jgi:hypothetical protein